MLFKEVIGQQIVKNSLRKSVTDGRISHAQLFLGSEGSGNLALAIAYAQYISCENHIDEDSCGVCPSCIKFAKLIHPDLHFVFPVVKSDLKKPTVSDNFIAEWRLAVLENPYLNQAGWVEKISDDKKKQCGIFEAESNEIFHKLNLKSYEAEYKTMIIWMPEKMHVMCANKLLKLLEEPAEKTLFILVSEDSNQLLTTILSRCQLVKIPSIDNSSIKNALLNLNVAEPVLSNLTRLANGNYLKALEMINQIESEEFNYNQFTKWMRLCYASKIVELISWVDEMAGIGREIEKNFLLFALRMIRENFMLTAGSDTIAYLSDIELSFAQKFHPFINEKNIFSITDELTKAHYHIESNANAKIVFLDLSLKMNKMLH